jgi:serine/threonine protein kinase
VIQIDGYRDLERIGHGGLGDVYRATRASTGSTVAIKVLRDISDSSVAWHRTRRELTALVSLSGHAHVIQLLELLDLPAGPALVMEYAPGGSVGGLLARSTGTLSVAEAVLIGRHTAGALVAAHEQGIVHRDLKPQNLLIDGYGQVKLCDFGIASLARSEEFRTRTSALSMRYASPEDLDEDAAVGPPSDVYSLGATLLHLVHGAPPTLKERLAPWTAPHTTDPDLAALDGVITACLHPTPSTRPTAGGLLERLETIDWTLTTRCRALSVTAPAAEDARPAPEVPAPSNPSVPLVPLVPSVSPADAAPPMPTALVPGSPALEHEWRGRGDVDDTSSATMLRPDRVVPAALPPRPSAARSSRRWPWIAGAVAVAAAIGVGLAIVLPDDDTPDASPTTTGDTAVPGTTGTGDDAVTVPAGPAEFTVVDRPAELPPLVDDDAQLWPFGEPGGCLVAVADADELAPIGCDQPHDLQRFAVGELDAEAFPEGAAFVADDVRAATRDACLDQFTEFVGVAAAESMFDVAVTQPSAATWSSGDRRFQCLLGVRDRQVVGDAAATSR